MWKGLFFGTAVLVALTHLLRERLGLVQWTLLLPVMVGVSGYFLISMIDYAASFFAAMKVAEEMEQAVPTEEQKAKVTEAVLAVAIQGHAPTPKSVERVVDLGMAVALGLLAGAALAWVATFLLSFLPNA